MLVLSRKSKESVVIGGLGGRQREFIVTVLEIRNGKVKLGFASDDSVSVIRSEVAPRIRPNDLPINPPEDSDA